MADRRATNKYYPPDWDPSKGSANSYQKSHPLRHRASKISQGILVVRFEMPFNIWCLKCENHIATGVRYNAEKSKVGNYYTSPIYKFKMKCHLCDNHFEIQTNPSKFDYEIVSGARIQARSETDDLNVEAGQSSISKEEETKRRMTDAMFRLEQKMEDQIKGEATLPVLDELKSIQSRWQDSFGANQLLRRQFRERRRKIEQAKDNDKKLLKRTSLRIPLVAAKASDRELAKEFLKKSKSDSVESIELSKKCDILKSSILPCSSKKVKSEGTDPSAKPTNFRVSKIKAEPGSHR